LSTNHQQSRSKEIQSSIGQKIEAACASEGRVEAGPATLSRGLKSVDLWEIQLNIARRNGPKRRRRASITRNFAFHKTIPLGCRGASEQKILKQQNRMQHPEKWGKEERKAKLMKRRAAGRSIKRKKQKSR